MEKAPTETEKSTIEVEPKTDATAAKVATTIGPKPAQKEIIEVKPAPTHAPIPKMQTTSTITETKIEARVRFKFCVNSIN